ncbi:heme-binding protein [Rhodohalobacter sp. SW132]|uniref:HEAT repeat domain-containing protein n=1 Tax=Rhodohalobacter sp. SW132 TaxID=2293433 RepID=UPI000E259A11|nr:HEAT repeat domain-containing protein [Rhodohalobacter sp. SW132]REL37625.1 heme-binding protein [Rhodohalobacter sp. SW132]
MITLPLLFLSGCGEEPPEPEIRTVSAEEAQAEARESLEEISVDLPDDLEISLWATKDLLGDPIAIHMDDEGKAWVTVTKRSRNSEFDIRDVDSSWLIESMKWETVEDRREFLHSELAPERSDENTWLPDRNEDGSHDWRDLTVMKEEIWRLEDLNGDGMADQAQLFIRDFHDEVTDVAGAVLHFNDEVFVGVGPDMWRLRDTNNDGMSDWKESISHGYNVHIGFSGHGMSGLTTGPDGRVYWGVGDMGFSVKDQDGKEWHYPNQGAILRSDPDGSNFEVFAAGVRNTHEFVFDKYGNLITIDNDGDHAGEFERLVYLVNGSDSGWRINWQFGKYTDPKNNSYKVWMDEDYYIPHWDDQAAHVLPPLAESYTGPAGMAYNPGTALNESYEDHFFVMSFRGSVANSPIYSFTLKENGASFELDEEKEALRGILAVGLDFGPDGALYMTDWVQGWTINDEGRIWKLDSPEDAESEIRVETKNLLGENFSDHNADRLIELMGHQDMRVRQKAQFELANRGDEDSLLQAIETSSEQLARIHGIWGLAQIGRSSSDAVEPLIQLLKDDDYEIRAQAARWLGDVRYSPAADAVTPLLQDEHPRVRFFAAEALGRMEAAESFDDIVAMLADNDDEDIYLRHAGAIALSRFDDADSVADLADHSSRAVRVAAVIAMKRLQGSGIVRFLEDEDEYIVTNAARAISDDHYIEDAIPELARLLTDGQFDNEPLIRRTINASLYSGSSEDAERLTDFATESSNPEHLRVEALNTLQYWEEPSIFDRVTGRHRGQISNSGDDARNALASVAERLLSDDSSDIRIAAIEAASELRYTDATPSIYALLEGDDSVDVRIAAVRGLRDLEYNEIDEAIRIALTDQESRVRMNALTMIPALDISDDVKVSLLISAFHDGSVDEKQTALRTLETLDHEDTRAFIHEQLDDLIAGELEPEVHLELIQAAEEISTEDFNDKILEYRAIRAADDPIAGFTETLYGGDAESGRQVFYQDAAAQCIRCHAVAGSGAEVGPDLSDVGNRFNREFLLQSLVNPSASVAPGYGVVTLTLQDGETVRGALEEETDETIVLLVSGEQRSIDKNQIEERTNSPSSMPPMGDLLTRNQLRDLVEFMTTLDGEE